MLSTKSKHAQSGFTMIEVMIVLAIAAIVLVGVLVAAQALQRSGRNQARQSDVGNIHAWIIEYNSKTGEWPDNNGTDYFLVPKGIAIEDRLQHYESASIYITDDTKGPSWSTNGSFLNTPGTAGDFGNITVGSAATDFLPKTVDMLFIVRKNQCKTESISTGKVSDLIESGSSNANVIIYALEGDDLAYCR